MRLFRFIGVAWELSECFRGWVIFLFWAAVFYSSGLFLNLFFEAPRDSQFEGAEFPFWFDALYFAFLSFFILLGIACIAVVFLGPVCECFKGIRKYWRLSK